jgi:hypothetical protein
MQPIDDNDMKAISMSAISRIAEFCPPGVSAELKLRVAVAIHNELITDHSEQSMVTWVDRQDVIALTIEKLISSKDDRDLISWSADQVALRHGRPIDSTTSAARVHGIYVDSEHRRLNSLTDFDKLPMKMDVWEAGRSSHLGPRPAGGSGCLGALCLTMALTISAFTMTVGPLGIRQSPDLAAEAVRKHCTITGERDLNRHQVRASGNKMEVK